MDRPDDAPRGRVSGPTPGLRSGAVPAASATVPGSVLFTAVRNEAPFLVEWIAYHKIIGFERIIVFANASDDGTEALLETLAAAGEIEYHYHEPPEGVSAQGNAARIANDLRLIPDGAVTIWLDADEFLNVRVGTGMVGDLIARLGGVQGILINWRCFGTAGARHFAGRLISETYTRASRRRWAENRFIKTLFLYEKRTAVFSELNAHRPQLAKDQFQLGDFLNGMGRPLSPNRRNLQWTLSDVYLRGGYVGDADTGYRLAQINHYAVRAMDSFLLKKARGSGMSKTGRNPVRRHTNDFFRNFDRNDVEETSILRHEAATTSEMARLRALPGVATAEFEALHRTAAMIAVIPPEEFASLAGEPLPEAAEPR